jgi:hypothetical protein
MRGSFVLPLLALGLTGHASMAIAQSPGTFTPTGNLSKPRQFHTATLLPGGKVLITGGFGTPTCCASFTSAELYDPSTGTFSAAGDMTTPRQMHTATVLPSGKVLIAGGRVTQQVLSSLPSAELYDPATGTFSATGNMATARYLHTATLLNSGKVLIAGGYSDHLISSAELYDPTTGTFTSTGDMTEPGAETSTLLPDGKVLITRSPQLLEPNHAELYDPETGTFTRTGDMVDPNQGEQPSATLLNNGKVLIAGGSLEDFGGTTSAELYDPATGAFAATGKMSVGIDAWLAATLLPEGNVLIAGRNGSGLGSAELYDPVTGTFSAAIDSQSAEGHTATLLADGTLLLSGGWICCGTTIATAQIYHPAVLVPSPVLFSLAGGVQGAILHGSTQQVVSPSNPAVAGEALEIYGTGLIDGSAIPPQVAIGGRLADVLFFGKAPGFTGLNQINVRVPGNVASGPAIPVRLNYLNRLSNEVTIGVQ